MKYSASDKVKYMGETTFVSSQDQNAVAVGTEPQEDYFEKAKKDREKAYTEAEETIKEAFASAGANQDAIAAAAEKATALAKRKTDQVAIENLLIAKGFTKVLAVIGDQSVTVVVEKDAVTAGESVQIQDAVMSQCEISLNNIKIVTVNG